MMQFLHNFSNCCIGVYIWPRMRWFMPPNFFFANSCALLLNRFDTLLPSCLFWFSSTLEKCPVFFSEDHLLDVETKKNKETSSVQLVFSNPSSQHCIKWYCIWKALAPIISSYLAHSSGLHYTLCCELSCCEWCHLADFNSMDIFLSLIKADRI